MLGNKMKKISAIALCTLLTCTCAAAVAGPAPWFKWRSKLNGKQVCSQTPIGPGWEKDSGAFKDSQCSKPSLR
jgi:hypothetical protein